MSENLDALRERVRTTKKFEMSLEDFNILVVATNIVLAQTGNNDHANDLAATLGYCYYLEAKHALLRARVEEKRDELARTPSHNRRDMTDNQAAAQMLTDILNDEDLQ